MLRSNRPDLDWHEEHGDRETAYVVIGTEFDEAALVDRLDDALVTDGERERIEAGESLDAAEPFPTEGGGEVVLREP
jgi:hypothetical protein